MINNDISSPFFGREGLFAEEPKPAIRNFEPILRESPFHDLVIVSGYQDAEFDGLKLNEAEEGEALHELLARPNAKAPNAPAGGVTRELDEDEAFYDAGEDLLLYDEDVGIDALEAADNEREDELEDDGDDGEECEDEDDESEYGHYKPQRLQQQAQGGSPVSLAQQAYLPAGGRAFVPQQGKFNNAPATFTVVPASFLPEPTTNATAAIDAALTAARLDAAQRGSIVRAGLVPIAAAFGASALTELFSRLRWSPAFLVRAGNATDGMLVQRLLLHIPGHFRELARRAPSAAEAFVLECLGWGMLSHVRDAVDNATRRRWWIPPAPDFVTAVPNPIPAVSTEVRQVITRLGFIDTTMPAGDWNGRYAAWRRGLPGRQWDSEVNAAQPGLPLYARLLSVPAHVNTAAMRAAFNTAWNTRVAAVDAQHPPMAAGAAQVTLSGLRNAAALRQDAPGNAPVGSLGLLCLQGLELAAGTFPLPHGGRTARRLTLLNQLHPVGTALFRAVRDLGWNDLLYQTSGAIAFRGVKHNPAIRDTAGRAIPSPFAAPTQAKVDRINNDATTASRAAVVRAARSARTVSDHALGIAVDINYPENVDNVAARPFGSMDPRLVALLEAFHFRWGAGFNPTDPHHFDYCQAACVPAAVAGRPAPPAGPLPGMIPNFPPSGRGNGPVVA